MKSFKSHLRKGSWGNKADFRGAHDRTSPNRSMFKFPTIDTLTGGLRRTRCLNTRTFLDWKFYHIVTRPDQIPIDPSLSYTGGICVRRLLDTSGTAGHRSIRTISSNLPSGIHLRAISKVEILFASGTSLWRQQSGLLLVLYKPTQDPTGRLEW